MTAAQVDRYCQRAGLTVALSAVVHDALVERHGASDLPPEMLRRAARKLAAHSQALALELQRIASAGSKPRRGGARAGAGRPRRGAEPAYSSVTAAVSSEEHAILREAAARAGKSLSAWLVEVGLRAAQVPA